MDTSTSVRDTLTNGLKGRKVRTTTSSLQVSPGLNSSGHLCYGCNLSLDTSPMIASVSGHHKWHIDCLRCCECDDQLSQERSCFIKNGRVYCREDYAKLVSESVRCAKCFRSISPSDWVRKAGTSVYHLACFACDLCQRQLSTGEQFTIDSVESKLLCKLHFGINKEVGDSHDSSSNDSTSSSSLKPSKTKRVRTTFTEEQLQVLQANFQIDSNPDGQDLERIAALTGLSKRVTQVWFQNSRARQKKYMNKSRSSTSSTSVTSTANGHGNSSSASSTSSSSSSSSSSSTSPASSGNGNVLVLDPVATSAITSKSVANSNGSHGNCTTSGSLGHQSPIAMLTADGPSGHAIHPGHMLGHHSMVNHIPCHGGLPPMAAGWVPVSTTDSSAVSTIGDSIESTTGTTNDLIGNLISNNNSWSNMTSITNGNACDSADDELTREASPI